MAFSPKAQYSGGRGRGKKPNGNRSHPRGRFGGRRAFAPSFDFYVVLDFEATCSNNRSEIPPSLQEIIEFPSVLVDARQNPPKVISEFQRYVRPVAIPTLTPFCTQLTGITQAVVDKGVSFEEAMNDHLAWLTDNGMDPHRPGNFAIVTCGDWDLRSMLPRQLALLERQVSKQGRYQKFKPFLCYRRWVNVKGAFQDFYCAKAGGMTRMLDHLRIPLTGRHHSGIDDCRNIAKIVMRLLSDGSPVQVTTDCALPLGQFTPKVAPRLPVSVPSSGGGGAVAKSAAHASRPRPASMVASEPDDDASSNPSPACSCNSLHERPALAAILCAQRHGHARAPSGPVHCPNYSVALAEIRKGRKRSHWIWYIWPSFVPVRGNVGAHARKFLLPSWDDVDAYLQNSELAGRLAEVTDAATRVLKNTGTTPADLFGKQHRYDAPKFVETVTVFAVSCMKQQNEGQKRCPITISAGDGSKAELLPLLVQGLRAFQIADKDGMYFLKALQHTVTALKNMGHATVSDATMQLMNMILPKATDLPSGMEKTALEVRTARAPPDAANHGVIVAGDSSNPRRAGKPPRAAGIIALGGNFSPSLSEAAVCIVTNRSGKVSFPKGGREGSESVTAAALREWIEETGLPTESLSFTGDWLDEAYVGVRYLIAKWTGPFELLASWTPMREDSSDSDPVVKAEWVNTASVFGNGLPALHPGRVELLRKAVQIVQAQPAQNLLQAQVAPATVVYLLAGQSNMVGRADPFQLRDSLLDTDTLAALEAAGAVGQLRLCYDHDQNFGEASHAVSNGFVNFSLGAQRSSKESILRGAAHFGPEVGIAAEFLKAGVLVAAPSAKTRAKPATKAPVVALAKFAMGSTSFRQGHWIPRGGAGFRPEVSRVDKLVEFAASALADPQLPQPVQLGGFFWLQGEGDCGKGEKFYQRHLAGLVDHVRRRLGIAMPFVASHISWCTRNGTFSPKLLKDQDKINRAISAACGTDFPVPQKASVRAKNDGGGGGGGGSGDHSGPCVDTAVSEVFADSLLQEWKRIQDMCGSIKIKGPPTQEQIAEQRSKKKAQAAAISAFLEKQGASSKSDKKKLAKALNTVLLPRKKTTSGKASTAGSVSTGPVIFAAACAPLPVGQKPHLQTLPGDDHLAADSLLAVGRSMGQAFLRLTKRQH